MNLRETMKGFEEDLGKTKGRIFFWFLILTGGAASLIVGTSIGIAISQAIIYGIWR